FRAPLWLSALAFSALLIAGCLFGGMAEEAREVDADDIDFSIPVWVRTHGHEWSGLTGLFRAVTVLGNFPVAGSLVLLAAWMLLALHRERIGGVRRADPFLLLVVTTTGWLLNVV